MPEKFQFDEQFLSSMKSQIEHNRKQDELKQEVAMRMRQMNLLNAQFKEQMGQKEYEFGKEFGLSQQRENRLQEKQDIDVKQFNESLEFNKEKFGAEFGLDKEKMLKDYEIDKGQLGLGYSKLAEDQRQFGLLLPIKQMEAEADYIKKTQGNKGDPTTQRRIAVLVGNINQGIAEDDEKTVFGHTEELIELAGLKNDTNIIWQDIKEGLSPEESIKIMNNYRKSKGLSEYTKDEKNYLKLYFKTRNY